jgi:hypothetical protein
MAVLRHHFRERLKLSYAVCFHVIYLTVYLVIYHP